MRSRRSRVEVLWRNAFKDENFSRFSSTNEIVIIPSVAQRSDVVRCRCSHLLRVKVLAIKQRLVINSEDVKIMVVDSTTRFAISHCEKVSAVWKGDAAAVRNVQSSSETVERMVEANFAVRWGSDDLFLRPNVVICERNSCDQMLKRLYSWTYLSAQILVSSEFQNQAETSAECLESCRPSQCGSAWSLCYFLCLLSFRPLSSSSDFLRTISEDDSDTESSSSFSYNSLTKTHQKFPPKSWARNLMLCHVAMEWTDRCCCIWRHSESFKLKYHLENYDCNFS